MRQPEEKQVKEFKRALGDRFDVKDLGKLHYFLGIRIVQDDNTGEVWIGQPAYTNKHVGEVWNGGCEVCGHTL